MRLLYITDTHIRGTSPQNRKDNFPETLRAKMKEVILLAKKHRVHALLHGGDLFDTPSPALAVCSGFIPILAEAGVPLYAIAGNHDLFGHNPLTLDRTMLGFLNRLGVVRLLRDEEPTYLEQHGIKVQLSGRNYHYDMDRRSPEEDYLVQKKDCDFAVHLVHGMLYDKKLPEGVPHTLIDKITHTEADVTISGHNHLGFQATRINGRLFLNPGSLVRLSNHPAEIKRKPAALLLEFTPNGVNYQYLQLKSAPPGEEVLDRTAIEQAAFQEEKLAEFVKGIKSSGEFQNLVIDEIIQSLADKKGVSKAVREGALARIAAARQRLEVDGSE
ncbi:MAG: repair protein SbcD/Mre11 [Clostridia bacterium]|jgi:DNA repair exonuclease SbcCD nuclease subunit|nr:serine/threonine protein phosphatase [Clostridiales bacterium]MDK2986520.1 repair protein SbcD/Mre11 [Clostridia bacterium]